jgi:antitoxin MazE
MKVALVSIGNSKDVRLPKAVLEQVGLTEEVDLSIENSRIILTPRQRTRTGWAAAFAHDAPALTEEDREWLGAPLADEDA